MANFEYSPVDFLFTCLGLVFLLLDIVLDIWAVVSLYKEKEYVSLGILLLFLVGSSVLVQAFSWLWYSYENFRRETTVEKCVSVNLLNLLHWLQLGIYFRHAGVVEVSVRSFFSRLKGPDEDVAVFLSHDLSMLRLIETFSESCPQLVLMLTIILQRGELDPWTVLKAIGSASAVACSVTMYHRSLRSFLLDKEKQVVLSSIIYFLWNLLLVMSRITALALFASVLPCYIFTHFICSWFILFFFVWRSKTNFMENACGEWLYRATVGLIWYFDWFNVVEGRTRYKTLFYHGYILVDICLLVALWCWQITATETPYFEISPLNAKITAVSVAVAYMLGLLLKLMYYKFLHPNLDKEQLKGDDTEKSSPKSKPMMTEDVPDSARSAVIQLQSDTGTDETAFRTASPPDTKRCNKRMRKLAKNFYS
ncbi:XK-related protein 8-like [Halichoeres trimaculatus]|uniref:XK-related protein 8-like n=1 Tax=Halichoeres trimaculatus TaxID=147232 RepID=UPI003D9EE8E8